MSDGRLRERAWQAHPEALALGPTGGGAHRAVLRQGALVGADLGVPHPWGVQLTAGDQLPSDAEAGTGLAWCQERGSAAGWRVSVPERLVGTGPWRDLVARDSTGVFATDRTTAAGLAVGLPDGVTLDAEPSLADVLAAYGGWMSDPPLAGLLVTPEDLDNEQRRFLVAHLDGRPAGCAFVWWAAGTGYLSGIGVLEELRGRGIGHALTAAAARLAAERVVGGPPDVVWMHATDDGAALYSRMGFTRVDTEVLLGPT